MFYVYILRSTKSGKHYIGSTNNLERRIKEHSISKSKALKSRGPFELIYQEEFMSQLEARRRERQMKSYKGGNAFRSLVSKSIS